MPVSSHHPEYDAYVGKWKLTRDVVNSKVKNYIKDIDVSDDRRCTRYRDDARFTNFTGRTKNGLVGAVFTNEPMANIPPEIEYLLNDATGSDISLKRIAQEAVGEVLQAGRYGLLVDFPASEDGLTAAEVETMGLRAHISRYTAESIINWQTAIINGRHKLVLVVLREHNESLGDDGFTWQSEIQYRVLRMVENVYVQQLYNQKEELTYEYIPRNFRGESWDHIPFVFVGAEDNDTVVDSAPLYDLAELNIGHLRNSADYEESVHITGQPTLMISTDMTPEQFAEANPNGVLIGARRGHNLGQGGGAQLLQAAPNQLADEAMKRKEEQAVMIGARLIMRASANETAEAARIKHSGENSVLSVIAHNVSDAIMQCLKWAHNFMSSSEFPEDAEYTLSKTFFEQKADPQLIMSHIQLYTSGLIAAKDVRDSLRKTGAIEADRTDEEIDSDINNLNPF